MAVFELTGLKGSVEANQPCEELIKADKCAIVQDVCQAGYKNPVQENSSPKRLNVFHVSQGIRDCLLLHENPHALSGLAQICLRPHLIARQVLMHRPCYRTHQGSSAGSYALSKNRKQSVIEGPMPVPW